MLNAGRCRYTGIDKEYSMEDLAAFHGHLGPFIVLGYRMGRYARRNLCQDPFQLKATVYCSGTPPESCIADGIQIGSGCTLGKRNIEIVISDKIRGEFSAGERKLVLSPISIDTPPRDDHDHGEAIELLAERMYMKPDSQLFDIIEG